MVHRSSDSQRQLALIALSIALLVQIIWFVQQIFVAQTAVSTLTRPLIFTAAFAAVAITRGRYVWINSVGRFVVASAFLLALWNRFDNFAGFIRYTGTVNSFMPASTIPILAVVATMAEITCCVLLFLGLKTRFAAAGAGVLLFSFATAMTISGLEQFTWAVYVLATGSLTLATVDASLVSLDGLFLRAPVRTS
jgi:uncharacterized membrane protein YphA (DoxX/SURF4 family)